MSQLDSNIVIGFIHALPQQILLHDGRGFRITLTDEF
jgi:hypothetical protein